MLSLKKGPLVFCWVYRELLFEGFVGDDLKSPVMCGCFTGIRTNHQKRNPMTQSVKRKVRGFLCMAQMLCLFFWWPIETDSSVADVNERKGFCCVT